MDIYDVEYIKTIDREFKKVRDNTHNPEAFKEYQIPLELLDPILNAAEKEVLNKLDKERSDKYNLKYDHHNYLSTITEPIVRFYASISYDNMYGYYNIKPIYNDLLEIVDNDYSDRIKGKFLLGRNKEYIIANKLNYYKKMLKYLSEIIVNSSVCNENDILSGLDKAISHLNKLTITDSLDEIQHGELSSIINRNYELARSVYMLKDVKSAFTNAINFSQEYKVVQTKDLVDTLEIVSQSSTSKVKNIMAMIDSKYTELEDVCNKLLAKYIKLGAVDVEGLDTLNKIITSCYDALHYSSVYHDIQNVIKLLQDSYHYVGLLLRR